MVLIHRQAPPNLHMTTLNPHINIDGFPLVLPKECTPLGTWKEENSRLFAGLSSFGFGGTNSHVVLESYYTDGDDKERKLWTTPPFEPKKYSWVLPSTFYEGIEEEDDEDIYEVRWEEIAPTEVSGDSSSSLILTWGMDDSLEAIVRSASENESNLRVVGEKKSMRENSLEFDSL